MFELITTKLILPLEPGVKLKTTFIPAVVGNTFAPISVQLVGVGVVAGVGLGFGDGYAVGEGEGLETTLTVTEALALPPGPVQLAI